MPWPMTLKFAGPLRYPAGRSAGNFAAGEPVARACLGNARSWRRQRENTIKRRRSARLGAQDRCVFGHNVSQRGRPDILMDTGSQGGFTG